MKPSPARPAYLATTGPPALMYTGPRLGDVVDGGALELVVLAVEVDPLSHHSSRINFTDSRSRAKRS